MKFLLSIRFILLAFLAITAHTFNFLPRNSFVAARRVFPKANSPTVIGRNNRGANPQKPIMSGDQPNDILPSFGPGGGDSASGDDGLIVSDILNKERDINAFASLARQIEEVSNRLNSDRINTTVLAPSNAAVQRLPRKPWESPRDYEAYGMEEAYAGQQGRERAANNLKKFVEMHVVPDSPWAEDKEVKTLGGARISWKKGNDGKKYIHPGNIEVARVATQVSNGEVWILDGIINY